MVSQKLWPERWFYTRSVLEVFKLRLELVVFVLVIIYKIIKFSRTKQSFTRNPEVVNSVRQECLCSSKKRNPGRHQITRDLKCALCHLSVIRVSSRSYVSMLRIMSFDSCYSTYEYVQLYVHMAIQRKKVILIFLKKVAGPFMRSPRAVHETPRAVWLLSWMVFNSRK